MSQYSNSRFQAAVINVLDRKTFNSELPHFARGKSIAFIPILSDGRTSERFEKRRGSTKKNKRV